MAFQNAYSAYQKTNVSTASQGRLVVLLYEGAIKQLTMAMSYKEFMDYAMQNYCRGGDCIVECWDELSFRYYCEEFGPMTKERADSLFRLYRNCEG